MVMSLLAGILIGIILAILPGPVSVTAIKLSLEKGSKHGILVGLGTAVMDFFFCVSATLATSAIIPLVEQISKNYPIAVLIVQISIVAGVMVYGFLTLKSKKEKGVTTPQNLTEKSKIIEYLTHRGPFLLGFAIALTNVANPSFMASITSVTVMVQRWGWIESSILGNTSYSIGFGLGTFIWLYTVVRVVIFYKPRMSGDLIVRIKKFAGLTFIGFGTLLGYRIIMITKWPEILRLIFAF